MIKHIILTIFFSHLIFAKGSELSRAKNTHSGNKVRSTFYNYGLVGRWSSEPEDIGGEWPINSGHEYIGDVGHLVGSEFQNLDGQLKKSVTTVYGPRGSEMNQDIHWGWEPLPGYTNPDTPLVAMSHMGPSEDDPDYIHTWPSSWPDKTSDPIDPGWSGSWNGYFGKNQKNAEQESYFVMDDYNDAEFNYFPDSLNLERRGLGLECAVRGLQWNHILAEDVLFWLYDIKNISDKNIDKMVFGYIVGTITGGDGDSQDDWADFDKVDDIAFSYDNGTDLESGLGGIGASGWSPVGLAGYAFLESPGNPYDGIDNDGDASFGSGNTITTQMFEPVIFAPGDTVVIIDYTTYERSLIAFPPDSLTITKGNDIFVFKPNQPIEEIARNLFDDNLNGIIDENNGASIEITPGFFEDYYLYIDSESGIGLKYIDYFTGIGSDNLLIDESRLDGLDNDGDWDITKDDVGLDGLAGSNDFGENDGMPTSGVGTDLPGEPNIDKTDIDESDQIGLSSFYYFNFGVGPQMNDDNRLWDEMLPGYFNNSIQNTDADFLFSSGYFPLLKQQTERFSIALLFGDNLPDLLRNKQTVQTIYNQNYNFAKAPDLPKVWAFAGDGYVTLYWDDKAEFSQDRITGEDFEGYKIYRATDTEWTDSGTITDAFGSIKFNVPIKQFDQINEHEGFFPGSIDGVQFYLGNNNGLVHTWTDSNVINGHQYFYAVTAYDHGSAEKEILPAETSKFVTIDKGGNVNSAKNVIAVTPDAPAAGYQPPPSERDVYSVNFPHGTGNIRLSVVDPTLLPDGLNYQIHFKDSRNNGFDDDNDWNIITDDIGSDGCADEYEDGSGGCLSNNSGVADANGDNWNDCGADGVCNENEEGYDPVQNLDPNGDDYDYQNNPLGTEKNNLYEYGEGTEYNSLADVGEPNIDQNDPDELQRSTSHLMIVKHISESIADTVIPWTQEIYSDKAIFDGMLIEIDNDLNVAEYKKTSGFYPQPELPYEYNYLPMEFSGITTKGVKYPRDIALVFSDSADHQTQELKLMRDNGAEINLPSLNVNYKIIDNTYPELEIEFAVIDQVWSYYAMDTTLINSSEVIPEYIYDPNEFNHLEVLDTVQGEWSEFGFIPGPFGSSSGIKISLSKPGYFSYADRIIIIEQNDDTSFVSWYITPGHDNIPNIHYPKDGDTLKLFCTKQFSSSDLYEFVSIGAKLDSEKIDSHNSKIKVVPNPYVAGASWEGKNPYSDGRGPRSIHFNHLPPNCKIKIFTLSGELVNTLYHNSSMFDGSFEWNMLTKDNLDIAYGVYIYHIEAISNSMNSFKPVLGKFAVIK